MCQFPATVLHARQKSIEKKAEWKNLSDFVLNQSSYLIYNIYGTWLGYLMGQSIQVTSNVEDIVRLSMLICFITELKPHLVFLCLHKSESEQYELHKSRNHKLKENAHLASNVRLTYLYSITGVPSKSDTNIGR